MCPNSWAETAYITDKAEITFRTGPGQKYGITAILLSGQPVEVMESQGDWSRVQILKEGKSTKEGWVLSRFLITRSPWKVQASELKEANAKLTEEASSLEKELSVAIRRGEELDSALIDTAAALKGLEKEHHALKEGAAGYLELKTAHTEIQSELETTQKEFGELSEKHKNLKASERWKWFGTGAGVFLSALVFGIVLGRHQKKRRSSYY